MMAGPKELKGAVQGHLPPYDATVGEQMFLLGKEMSPVLHRILVSERTLKMMSK